MIDFGEETREFETGTAPDLTPMIDVIFQLLVFFLLTSFALAPALSISLPRSSAAGVSERPPIEIAIPAAGPYLVDGRETSVEAIPDLLAEAKRKGASTIALRADTSADFGRVVTVLDAAADAGFEGADVLTEPER